MEQMAGSAKTLTALGTYWKGRKPLILNKACILGCLLPATDSPKRDLEIFERLMAMDDESFVARWPRRARPREILAQLSIARVADCFVSDPPMLLRAPYRERVGEARRPEELTDTVHEHIWDGVNARLGTSARSFTELVEQLGVMRLGHRPRVGDAFCGSGHFPFAAARLGCDVSASGLNPVACMLTWGAFNIVGGSKDSRVELECELGRMVEQVQAEIDRLGVETDCKGWPARM